MKQLSHPVTSVFRCGTGLDSPLSHHGTLSLGRPDRKRVRTMDCRPSAIFCCTRRIRQVRYDSTLDFKRWTHDFARAGSLGGGGIPRVKHI
jgi:hypothetical protein